VNLSSIHQDARFALRMLRKSPVFTAVAVGSLALGIGANTAIFTLVDAILLRWLPVRNPQELVVLARNPARPSTSFNYPDYRYVRDHGQSYSGLIAFSNGGRPTSFRLPGSPDPTRLVGLSLVSGNYFDTLGVRPALGRLFNPADNEGEGAHPLVVLSNSFWKRAFGADSGVVGRNVELNGARFQVIGVSGEGFTGASVGVAADVFAPIIMYRTFSPTAIRWDSRNYWWLTVIGRLKPGVTPPKAEAEFGVLWQRILAEDPNHHPPAAWDTHRQDDTVVVLPGSQGYSGIRTQTSKPLTILTITVALVLLIACANVANLLLARGVARRREIAVRLSVGAPRSRLIAQMLAESLLLGALGGLASLAFAWIGVRALLTFLPRGPFPVDLNLSVDFRVLGFTFGLSLLCGLLFGLAPAIRASKPNLVDDLKSDSFGSGLYRGGRWDLRRTLVSFQVALSLLLLAGAGLFVRTLRNLRDMDPGMVRENLLFVTTNIGQLGYQPQRDREFHDRLRAEVQRLPSVRAVGLAAITPLSESRWNQDAQIEGYTWRPDEPPYIDMNAVTPRYFEAAGIPIVLGRDFRDSDNLATLPSRPAQAAPPGADAPEPPGPPRVVVVNEAFSRHFFGGQPAVGRRLCLGDKWDAAKAFEIVGVVRDARYFDLKKAVEPMIYEPAYRDPGSSAAGGTLAVRTTGDPGRIAAAIRQAVQHIDGAVTVIEARTMEDNLNRELVQERFVATLGGFFGLIALLLAAMGLYGVMSQAVTRRTREIGIRMALGAGAPAVLWMVLRDAIFMVLAGAALGIPAVLILTRYTESMLFGVKAQDPATLAMAALLLLAITMIAGLLPARRATMVHPMTALRHD
jgi:predicted permease